MIRVSFVEYRAQDFRWHRHNALVASHPVRAFVLDGHSYGTRRNGDHHDAAIGVFDLISLDIQSNALALVAFQIGDVEECAATDYLSVVVDAQQNASTVLVRQRHAVPRQFIRVELRARLLEFQAFAFPLVQPALELFQRDCHVRLL